jgi:UDP-glucose 4-epimerase
MEKKNVVVLGATGSLGTHIAVHMKKCGYKVFAVGHHKSDNGFYADFGITYLRMDISNPNEFILLPQENVWAVFHFAGALPAVMEGFNGSLYVSSIMQGTLNVLEYCRKVKADRIIFPQSLYDVKHLFGSKTPIPADMTHVAPMEGDHAVYVICKNAAVDLIEHYYQTYGIKRFVFRLSRIYLYHPNPYTYTDGKKVLVSDRYLIYRAMKGERMEIWGDPDRLLETISIYDFLQIMEKAASADIDGGFYNVGSGGSTLRERIQGIVDVFSPKDKPCDIVYCPEKQSAMQFVLDYSKTAQELGYKPQYSWKQYLEAFKQEMEKQPFAKIWGREEDYFNGL